MFYSASVFVLVLASANAFSVSPKASQRLTSLRMSDEPWFPNSVTSNVVEFDDLESVFKKSTSKAQDFLEANPYWDNSNLPLQTFKAADPLKAKIVSVKRIVGAAATGETCDIIIDHFGKMPYWEGQSYGVVPPGINPKNGKPNTNRLYSIASTRYGDDMKGTTTTLCVRRATYYCPELKADDPAKKGICSNYLCDSKPGDEVLLTGPAGKVMLMPEKNPATDLIMVATGTGIAPYRSFLRRLFVEDTPAGRAYKGLAWLFLGVANTDALLYDQDWAAIKAKFPDNFRYDYALSREGPLNKKGGKMYIQDKVEEYSDEVFDRMEKGAHMYFCGLKGMMPGILEMLEGVAKSKGIVWADKLKHWKEEGQWHVEVY
jgi:ferredoxin--NADP+ reductase